MPRPVVVSWHRLGPYHHARLAAAATALPVVGLEISAVDKVNAWAPVVGADDFRKVSVFPCEHPDTLGRREVEARLHAALEQLAPAALVIHGWADRAALILLAWALKQRVSTIVMSESTPWDGQRVWMKEKIKGAILELFDGALVGGTPHALYLERLGVPRERVFLGYDAVDNAHFARGARSARAAASDLRRSLVVPERFFLASARFVGKKNLLGLLEAYALYRRQAGEQAWGLVLLGDGELRCGIEAARTRLGLEDSLLLPGFKQYDELPTWYGLASCFVHASTVEQWGLVVNEAMAAGLPVLVSDRCGCATDLVREGINGFTFDPRAPSELAASMQRITHDDARLRLMGLASARIIDQWGPSRFATGLAAAVDAARAYRPTRRRYPGLALLRLLSR